MNKVFIVTVGEYSDYHIEAVFTDKSIADEFVIQFNNRNKSDYDKATVEEFPLDNPKDSWEVTLVWMKQDGTVISTRPGFNEELGLYHYDKRNDSILYVVATTDPIRAIKVTNEHRAQLIANNLWGKTYNDN